MLNLQRCLPIIKRNQQTGFTLIELVIVIVLGGIIAAISMKLLTQGLSAFLGAVNVTNADQQARLAIERMVRDIRSIRSASDIITATNSQFSFTNFSGNNITYTLSSNNLMYNSQILANGIGALGFNYYDNNGNITATLSAIRYIAVNLTITQGNSNFTIGTAIYPENLT